MTKKVRASKGRRASKDRISDFPHGILHRIISFLPKKDAYRMVVLSKTWKHVLHTYPYLDFSPHDFGEDQPQVWLSGALTEETIPKILEILDKLVSYVDLSMLRFSKYEFTLQRFTLFIQLPDLSLASRLDKWLLLAVEKGVNEVHLAVETPGPYLPGTVYTLPKPFFAATSITVLKLYGCHLEESSFCIKWYSLKMLALEGVCIREGMVRKLVTCCPLIEDISFKECCGFKNVKIFGPSRLKILHIFSTKDVPESVEIASSPSLEYIHFSFKLEAGVCAVKLGTCQALKTLLIRGASIPEQFFVHFDSKFPILKGFLIIACLTSERVKISSRSVQDLVIGLCNTIDYIEIDTPNLIGALYFGSVVPVCRINAPAGCIWRIDFVLESPVSISWYLKLKEFLVKLNKLDYLHIYIRSTEILFNAEDFITATNSPTTIEDLAVTVDPHYPISNYTAIMDGLLWCYRPQNLLIRSTCSLIRSGCYRCDILVEYLSESSKGGDDLSSCCNHGNVRYWKCDLKKVTVTKHFEDFGVERTKFHGNRHILDNFSANQCLYYCKMAWQLI